MAITDQGLFIETTSVYDLQSIQSMDANSKEFKDFIVKLTQVTGRIAKALNLKDTGIYDLNEFVCGKTFFPSNLLPAWATTNPTSMQQRQIYRKEFLVTLPLGLPAGDYPFPHNLNINIPAESIWSMTDIYGTTNDITNRSYLPLPYVGTVGDSISLWVDANNIHIHSAVARASFTLTYVTLEYLKS